MIQISIAPNTDSMTVYIWISDLKLHQVLHLFSFSISYSTVLVRYIKLYRRCFVTIPNTMKFINAPLCVVLPKNNLNIIFTGIASNVKKLCCILSYVRCIVMVVA